MDKAKKIRILLIVLVAAAAVLAFVRWQFSPEKTVERIFFRNEEALNEMVESYLAGDTDALKANIPGVEDADHWYGEHTMIEFFVKGRGIAPASSYYGFYYSADDVPLAFQNAKMTLTPSDDGWEWKEGGDNRGFTKKLTDNWYYYEASF